MASVQGDCVQMRQWPRSGGKQSGPNTLQCQCAAPPCRWRPPAARRTQSWRPTPPCACAPCAAAHTLLTTYPAACQPTHLSSSRAQTKLTIQAQPGVAYNYRSKRCCVHLLDSTMAAPPMRKRQFGMSIERSSPKYQFCVMFSVLTTSAVELGYTYRHHCERPEGLSTTSFPSLPTAMMAHWHHSAE